MIRFVKYLTHEQLSKFKGEIPAHSCIIECYEKDSSQLYKTNTDKVISYPKNMNWSVGFSNSMIEFIMLVHERKKSNTTCFSQDYTIAKFISDMLKIEKGRFTQEGSVTNIIEEKYKFLEDSYSKYVLEGVLA